MFSFSEINQETPKCVRPGLLIQIWGSVPEIYFLIAQQLTLVLCHVWEWQSLSSAGVMNRTYFLGFSAPLTKYCWGLSAKR